MNLIYMCIFHQESYINLLKLLITSISEKANINKKTTDILIITSPSFQLIIQNELKNFDLPLNYYILDLHTLFDSVYSRLLIFDYENINKYDKILYLDTDVLINSDINVLFDIELSSEKLYALEEGWIGHEFWGSQFFDFTKFNPDTPAFSAGVLYYLNSNSIINLFDSVKKHIHTYLEIEHNQLPVCMEQTFLVYNSFIQDKYDNQLMKKYLENNPSTISNEKIIYHFPGKIGDYSSKCDKMNIFLNKMRYSIYNQIIFNNFSMVSKR